MCPSGVGAEWIQGFVHGSSSTRAHAADFVSEIADKVREGGGHLLGLGGWTVSCTDSNTTDQSGCCATSAALSGATRRFPEQVNY